MKLDLMIVSVLVTLGAGCGMEVEPADARDLAVVDEAVLDAAFAVVEAEDLETYLIVVDGVAVHEQADAEPYDLATNQDPVGLVDCIDGCCYWVNSHGPGTRVCCSSGSGPAACSY
jgi:hypothetical protein